MLYLIFQTCKETQDIGALQKAADFVKAFTLGFDVDVSFIFGDVSFFPVIVRFCLILILLCFFFVPEQCYRAEVEYRGTF